MYFNYAQLRMERHADGQMARTLAG